MKTTQEIDKLLKAGERLPEFSDTIDEFYYLAVDTLIKQYKLEMISKSEFTNLKTRFENIHYKVNQEFAMYKRNSRRLLGVRLCPKCEKILTGLDVEYE